MVKTERELVCVFKETKLNRDKLKGELKEAQVKYEHAESNVIEHLENREASATAKYDNLGYIQLQKPRLYASCKQENLEYLFRVLKERNREDMIKSTVAPQTLSAYAKECIEEGEEIPECISYYLKPSLRLYD